MQARSSQVTVIVSCYKRPQYLLEHLSALENQTVAPEILIWSTETDDETGARFAAPEIQARLRRYPVAHNTQDFGVWGRFAFALAAETEFVCIIDDDQIPGARWIENCLASYETNGPGIYGPFGHIFDPKRPDHAHSHAVGTFNPSDELTRVDVLGHCWFMHRDALVAFWREPPLRSTHPRAGENIHLAHMAQRYLGWGCFVTPQPENDLSLWGADPTTAKKYGRDAVSIYRNEGHGRMDDYLRHVLEDGFQLLRSDPAHEHAFREVLLRSQSRTAEEIRAHMDPGQTFILAGSEQFDGPLWPGCRALPFLEKEGVFWGRPKDSGEAISELERMKTVGASAIVFPWSSLWWLTYYRDFAAHLRARYRCVVANDGLVIYSLVDETGR